MSERLTVRDRLQSAQRNVYYDRIQKAMFVDVVDQVWRGVSVPLGRQVETGFVRTLETESRYDD